ncbi:MAG: hypothetical protein ABSG63_16920, partial [Spirochaetia bacterium]
MSERRSLASLFLVSLFGLSFETFLSRYFAVALFSDYSYWVISLALLGYSFGGVFLTLFRDHFHRNSSLYLFLIPPLLLAASLLAFLLLRANPFNPLALQNDVLWKGQIKYIFLYYAGLFPVFFLTGTYIGLNFLMFSRNIPRVYAVDLLGAAGGAILILAAMFLVHPYHLPAVMLPVLFAAIAINTAGYFPAIARPYGSTRSARRPWPIAALAGSLALLGVSLYLVLSVSAFSVPDFKKLHAILGIRESKIIETRVSPAGSWLTVDDYTEYDDVSMTNNYGSTASASPPRAWGLYRDAARVTPLLKQLPTDFSYLAGSLPYFPYVLRPRPRVLLVGTNGGFKMVESSHSGAASGLALEQPGDIYRFVRERLQAVAPEWELAWGFRLQRGTIFSLPRDAQGSFDLIEIAGDFLSQDSNNSWSFTLEAMEGYLRALKPGGILSIPVDISEFNVYALKMVDTMSAALVRRGVADPSRYIMAYRTAWTCQILVSNQPFSAADISSLVAWCADRSFDTPWYPGIDPAKIDIWNDLPPVSFQQGEVQVSQNAQDALMNDLVRMFARAGSRPSAGHFFNLTPSTMDRPDFTSISRLTRVRTLLARLQVLPEKEIGWLLNLVVLAQALVLALVVLFLPLGAGRKALRGGAPSTIIRVFLYFSALGFGFFFIELALIDKLSFFLESATLSFGIVLAGVLVFSGLGSWRASRFAEHGHRGLLGGLVVIAASLVFFTFGLDPLMRACVGLPMALKIAIAVVIMAPLSFALGRPFALGTSSLGAHADSLIPWAWAINGAFSVVAT